MYAACSLELADLQVGGCPASSVQRPASGIQLGASRFAGEQICRFADLQFPPTPGAQPVLPPVSGYVLWLMLRANHASMLQRPEKLPAKRAAYKALCEPSRALKASS